MLCVHVVQADAARGEQDICAHKQRAFVHREKKSGGMARQRDWRAINLCENIYYKHSRQ